MAHSNAVRSVASDRLSVRWVAAALAVIGLAAAGLAYTAPTADAAIDPPCPENYFEEEDMWEVTWGLQHDDTSGTPTFTMDSFGGLEGLNGGPVPSYMTDHENWRWLYVGGDNDGRVVTYDFADGTVITATVSIPEDGCPSVEWVTTEPAPETMTEQVEMGEVTVTVEGLLGDDPSGDLILASEFFEDASTVGPLPPDVAFPHGAMSWLLNVAEGSSVTLTLELSSPANVLYKHMDGAWSEYPATFSGTTVAFELTDGGAGDADGVVNGEIVDPVAAGVGGSFTG